MLAGSAEIQGTLIMEPLAVLAAVQEMLTANRTEVLYTIDLLKEKKVATRHTPWASQSTCQPAADRDS